MRTTRVLGFPHAGFSFGDGGVEVEVEVEVSMGVWVVLKGLWRPGGRRMSCSS
jgi:hypothetical protein